MLFVFYASPSLVRNRVPCVPQTGYDSQRRRCTHVGHDEAASKGRRPTLREGAAGRPVEPWWKSDFHIVPLQLYGHPRPGSTSDFQSVGRRREVEFFRGSWRTQLVFAETRRSTRQRDRELPGPDQTADQTQPLVTLAESVAGIDFMSTYTVAEVARILRITPDKCYELIHTGDIPHLKLGRQFRVSKFALWTFLAGLDRAELVEEVMDRFVRQHCCAADACENVSGGRALASSAQGFNRGRSSHLRTAGYFGQEVGNRGLTDATCSQRQRPRDRP